MELVPHMASVTNAVEVLGGGHGRGLRRMQARSASMKRKVISAALHRL